MAARVGDAAALRRALDEAALVVAAGEVGEGLEAVRCAVAAEANEARETPLLAAVEKGRLERRAGCSCLRARLYLAVALLSLAAAVGAVYLAFKPRQPAYSVVSLVVSGLAGVGNASAPGAISPGFVATVRADNSANGKVGVHYDGAGSRVAVLYEGVSLADGAWPAFYQAPGNVTVFVVRAKGAGIRFSERERGQMAAAERLKSVMFDVDITVPVRLQLGGVRTWALPVTVRCAMAVDRLAASAKVVSRSCDVKVSFLFWRN
uniref:Late embryogenesis abundant protein LEA-2 subgroup domain-containing protein n=1 Tax=Hordeum vulgare subsp. vulgare TaxID=112509 RepID=A0A8I6WPX1_HORVV